MTARCFTIWRMSAHMILHVCTKMHVQNMAEEGERKSKKNEMEHGGENAYSATYHFFTSNSVFSRVAHPYFLVLSMPLSYRT